LFRLNTLDVTLPTLRQRTDFDDIARHLLRKIDPEAHISEGAIDELSRGAWAGNIRELKSVLSRLTLTENNGWIDEHAVTDALGDMHDEATRTGAQSDIEIDGNLHELQRTRVLSAYAQSGHNISKTARSLGVSRNTIYRALNPRQK
jgi:transcriptional regulator of acetoin/glycerol metabolism